jgi:hypothetical protein
LGRVRAVRPGASLRKVERHSKELFREALATDLKRLYSQTLDEPVPDEFHALLERLDQAAVPNPRPETEQTPWWRNAGKECWQGDPGERTGQGSSLDLLREVGFWLGRCAGRSAQ